MIYFIGTKQKVKIGFTNLNPKKRLSEMKRDNPEELFLYFTFKGDRTTENEFHIKFKKYHIQNEWFEINGELKEFINNNSKKIIEYSRKRKRHFGDLSKLRLGEGLTIQSLADKVGLKGPSIWDTERSYDSGTISLKTLKKYCNYLNYDVFIEFKKRK